jgi:hypothetical protein
MLQADYQLVLIPYKLVLQGAYTAIPTPGQRPGIPLGKCVHVACSDHLLTHLGGIRDEAIY